MSSEQPQADQSSPILNVLKAMNLAHKVVEDKNALAAEKAVAKIQVISALSTLVKLATDESIEIPADIFEPLSEDYRRVFLVSGATILLAAIVEH